MSGDSEHDSNSGNSNSDHHHPTPGTLPSQSVNSHDCSPDKSEIMIMNTAKGLASSYACGPPAAAGQPSQLMSGHFPYGSEVYWSQASSNGYPSYRGINQYHHHDERLTNPSRHSPSHTIASHSAYQTRYAESSNELWQSNHHVMQQHLRGHYPGYHGSGASSMSVSSGHYPIGEQYPTSTMTAARQAHQFSPGLASQGSSPPATGHIPSDSPFSQSSSGGVHPMLGCPPLHQNGDMAPTVKKGKSGRGRGRRSGAASQTDSPEQTFDRVFIWDLDDTLIKYNSLLTMRYCQDRYGTNDLQMAKSMELGKEMERLMNWLGDNFLFYEDIEDVDQTHIDDVIGDDDHSDLANYNFREDGFINQSQTRHMNGQLSTIARGSGDWMRKLAYRYRRIKELYNQYRGNIGELLGDFKDKWESTLSEINSFTDGFNGLGRKCVEITNQREKCANVLVSQTPLIPTISLILLYGLGPYFDIDNIYSAHKVGKENMFLKLTNKYGKKCTYVVIGDGNDEQSAAQRLDMPFWKVTSHPDLINLQRALVDFHM